MNAFVLLLDTGQAGSSSNTVKIMPFVRRSKPICWKCSESYMMKRKSGAFMWAAEQILRLKEQPGYEDIELVVALPFVGHDAKWDQRSKRRMEFILQHCSKKEVIGNEDCRESYVKRNCYMVDQANYLVAVYDDGRNLRSGTMQCVRYAQKNHVPVVLIHPDTAIITW